MPLVHKHHVWKLRQTPAVTGLMPAYQLPPSSHSALLTLWFCCCQHNWLHPQQTPRDTAAISALTNLDFWWQRKGTTGSGLSWSRSQLCCSHVCGMLCRSLTTDSTGTFPLEAHHSARVVAPGGAFPNTAQLSPFLLQLMLLF